MTRIDLSQVNPDGINSSLMECSLKAGMNRMFFVQ